MWNWRCLFRAGVFYWGSATLDEEKLRPKTKLGVVHNILSWVAHFKWFLCECKLSYCNSSIQALEELSIEKQTMKERYDQALETAKTTSEASMEQLKAEHASLVSEMESRHKTEMENATKMAAEELDRLQKVCALVCEKRFSLENLSIRFYFK